MQEDIKTFRHAEKAVFTKWYGVAFIFWEKIYDERDEGICTFLIFDVNTTGDRYAHQPPRTYSTCPPCPLWT